MERGRASITLGVGRIQTANKPTPVGFNPADFPSIVDDQDVQFARDPQDASWATKVVAAAD